ncbi:hypothetical protein [Tsukamurella sp. 1534]|uniref:hypothetical protein n=1 Tax=Tsukamurella sp. 1534 TaxID=1151061 RepID=UPI0005927F9F|nr:hypothetical protein [Tsukamurella sp. 1534]
MNGGAGESPAVAPMVVRLGFRPAGVALLLGWILSGIAMLAVLVTVFKEGGGGSAVVIGALSLAIAAGMFGLVAFLLMSIDEGREDAVIEPDGVVFLRVPYPGLQSWGWSEITRITTSEESARGVRLALVFHFHVEDERRLCEMEHAVPAATRSDKFWFRSYSVATVRVTPFHTPSPRAVSRYIYSVAPELGLELIPPRHRPKGYPWRDISGDGTR